MAVFFEDDFESGNLNSWTSVNAAAGTNIEVSSVWAKQGIKSVLFANNGLNGVVMNLQKVLSSAVDEVYLRVYFKFSALTIASSGYVHLAGLRSAYGTVGQLRLVPQGGGNCLQLLYYDGGVLVQKQSVIQVLVDTVYCLELHYKRGGLGDAELNVFLDGVLVADLVVAGISINSVVNSVLLGSDGASYPGVGNSFSVFYDCVVVSDSYVGPLPGGGGGLTVTYDANWPKGLPGNGEVPVDGASYSSGNFVYVKTNPGGLSKAGYALLGWAYSSSASSPNFQVTGGSFTYPQGFAIAGNTVLYAVWDWGLFEAGTIKAYGDVFVNNKVLPFEKWVNDTPTPSNPENKVLNVDIGSTAWPFRYIHGLELKTDCIAGLTNKDLTLKPYAGKKLNLDGNVYIDGNLQITGTLTGGSGSGGTFDGGVINIPLEIKCDFKTFDSSVTTRRWMYAEYPDLSNWLNASSPGIGLRFAQSPAGAFTDLFPTKFAGQDGAPGIAVNHHFFVRKDFLARGMIDSMEGILVLHGNGKDAVPPQGNNPGNDSWNIGWGPRAGGAPFIWLAEGGDRLYDAIGGNPAASTLLIVTNNDPAIQSAPIEIPGFDIKTPNVPTGKYKWGNLEAGDVISHGFLKTSRLMRAASSGFIALYNDLEPNGSNIHLGSTARPFEGLVVKDLTVTGKLYGNPFDQSLNKADAVTFTNVTIAGISPAQGNLTTNGSITCHGSLDVGHLRRDGGIFIALYSSIEPNGSDINLGSSTREFEYLYVKNVVATNNISCGGTLYTSHLRRTGTTGFIALYNSMEPNGSNIDLGSSTRQFEHLYVKNITVSGTITGGGVSGILKGVNVQTNSSGVGTVTFPAGHFSSTPAITVFPVDSQGRSINLVITSQSASGFTVQATITGAHSHKIGEVNTTSTNPFTSGTESRSHGHLINGSLTTAGSGAHFHDKINYSSTSQSGPSTGNTTPSGGASHNHTTTMYPASSTNNVSDHTHSYQFTDWPTNDATFTHTHDTSLSYRQLSLRTITGAQEFCGGVLYNGLSNLVQLYTEQAAATTVQVYFNWTAV